MHRSKATNRAWRTKRGRKAEVLYWVVQGKTSNDIGNILGNSPCTVNKHREHIFEKRGVETRTAAANFARGKLRGAQVL
jgi:DNA-binding CsgD family transcriptional regulator